MPQIPYSPVPSVAATEAATPSFRLNTPEGAFGGGVAAAEQGLGQSVSGVGNELWTRAVALQELHNETDAKNANVDFIGKAGDLHANYNALQGQERVNAFPKYQQDLKDLYQSTRGALGNPSAQRMFDGAAISTLNRSIFNAAGSAATAQSQAALGAANAEHDIVVKGVYNDPNDEAAFRDAIAKSDASAVTKAALSPGGASPERVADIKQQGRSEIAYNRVVGMARNQPNQAYKLLDSYEKEGLLFGPQDTAARNKVESLIASTGMNVVANQILAKHLQADGTYDASAADMQAEAVKTAKGMYPDIEGIDTHAQAALDRNYNQHSWGVLQDQRARSQEVSDNIVKGVTSVDNLPPDLVKRMTPTEIKAFPAQANSYVRAEAVQTNEAQYRELLGQYNNDNAKFMDRDIMREPGISKQNMDYFLKLQRSEAANGDPRVSRAMNWLKGANPQILDDLGVTGKAKDPDTANQFVGALHEAIQSYQETNGKPPDEKTITGEIFPTITRQVTRQGWLWNSKTPFFSASVPDAYAEKYKTLKPDATDPEIRQNYNRQMFDEFFKTTKATKDQSRVGQ